MTRLVIFRKEKSKTLP